MSNYRANGQKSAIIAVAKELMPTCYQESDISNGRQGRRTYRFFAVPLLKTVKTFENLHMRLVSRLC